ncbi:MAG: Orotidine 5'-phosphate decarboxylase [Phycisphaerae bacterium]|nr:Orotidine 5'-phosphate decarboxylase [Phycisphaerae bacterium]
MNETVEHFADRLARAVARAGGPTVVGIDPNFERLPADLRRKAESTGRASDQLDAIFQFCAAVLEAVAPVAAAVKFQSAYFEVYRGEGVDAYYSLIHEARQLGLVTIGDVKRGDIGSTAEAYAAAHLSEPAGQTPADAERIRVTGDARLGGDPELSQRPGMGPEISAELDRAAPDAITVNPYLGIDGVEPFLSLAAELGKGIFALVRTSNKSAGQLQDFADAGGVKLYEHLAGLVEGWASAPGRVGSCGDSLLGAVVGATWPQQARELRAKMPHCIFLVPGYGAQGASADDCMASFRADGTGGIVNASRSILYAFDREPYKSRFGGDWEAAIRAAATDFRDDLARAIEKHCPKA